MRLEADGHEIRAIIAAVDLMEPVGLKSFSPLAVSILLVGCASNRDEIDCALGPAELAVLKPRVTAFLDSTKAEGARCEEISSSTLNIPRHGCGIYGGPAGSSRAGCPDAFDGDYFVIFNPQSLEPSEVVLIAH